MKTFLFTRFKIQTCGLSEGQGADSETNLFDKIKLIFGIRRNFPF
ncbi:hypothetical protein LEP1GSC060_3075 [Leptospira weilii serovar Ranarum str. ICFT]|uniref:Uncharacterized protein n=1 Tax=Leptospira weilii serovar Ranarum str. ICFT TaxID=1218598 RepID=N1WAE9_9LEPT|nr:hypothetical protein LEP1GSC060_3075 [Leptospira weilii serovar Ranarum str. ICFT]